MSNEKRDRNERTLWVFIEERDAIKNIQLVIFGASIGFMLSYIAKDFIIDGLYSRPILEVIIAIFFFSVTLFLYMGVSYICHQGNINHVTKNINTSDETDNFNHSAFRELKRCLIKLSFYLLLIILLIISSLPYFLDYVAKIVFISEEIRMKNDVFTYLTMSVFVTWFITSFWINKEFPDPMDELHRSSEAEKNGTTPP